ncbi:hypothetical protein [Streptomyces sp. NBC_00273]|nr:hypothetical protein [Streptomyces sp. NBC_00273]
MGWMTAGVRQAVTANTARIKTAGPTHRQQAAPARDVGRGDGR